MARGSKKRRGLLVSWIWRTIRRQPKARPCLECVLTVSDLGQMVGLDRVFSIGYSRGRVAPRRPAAVHLTS